MKMPVRPLPPVLAEKSRIELNEDMNKIIENLQLIKNWLKDQPHLKARTDDQWLVAFLRGCKYRMHQVKAKIELYYMMRSTAPYIYSVEYNDPKVIDIIEAGIIAILPKVKNPGDPKVFLLNPAKCDPKEYSIFDIMSVAAFMFQISFMEDDDFTVSGITIVVNLSGAKLHHYTQASLKQIRNLMLFNQDGTPLRIKSTHFLNTPRLYVAILNFIKRFFNDKVKKRIHMYNSMENFQEHTLQDILPIEYGGTASNMQEIIDYWKRKIHAYRGFFEEDLLYGVDETKRHLKIKKTEKSSPALDVD